jgi:hypothetical protein
MVGKKCKEDEILNPETNRCVKKTGAIGKKLLGKEPVVEKKSCKDDEVLNPKTKRCVKKSGAVGKELLKSKKDDKKEVKETKVKKETKKETKKEEPFIKPKSINRLEELHKLQMEAMRNRDIKRIRELQLEIEEEKKRISEEVKGNIPKFLEKCKDSSTNALPKLPTTDGDSDMADVIKDEKQLIIIDGLCYDIKSLYELIKVKVSYYLLINQ